MPTPHVVIDPGSSTPTFRQIADQLRIELAEGSFAPGAPLPSMRRLASTLDVHFNTIAKAYQQLAREGWLELRHGCGAVVLRREAGSTEPGAHTELRQRLRTAMALARGAGVSAEEIAAELEGLATELRQF
jgi:DNA-binding transcriptional regulator YhcF (GntR family)